jgi:hypothetical protein
MDDRGDRFAVFRRDLTHRLSHIAGIGEVEADGLEAGILRRRKQVKPDNAVARFQPVRQGAA